MCVCVCVCVCDMDASHEFNMNLYYAKYPFEKPLFKFKQISQHLSICGKIIYGFRFQGDFNGLLRLD